MPVYAYNLCERDDFGHQLLWSPELVEVDVIGVNLLHGAELADWSTGRHETMPTFSSRCALLEITTVSIARCDGSLVCSDYQRCDGERRVTRRGSHWRNASMWSPGWFAFVSDVLAINVGYF